MVHRHMPTVLSDVPTWGWVGGVADTPPYEQANAGQCSSQTMLSNAITHPIGCDCVWSDAGAAISKHKRLTAGVAKAD